MDEESLACDIALMWLSVDLTDDGLVPSSNKSLLEPMLSQIQVAIWRHKATLSELCMMNQLNLRPLKHIEAETKWPPSSRRHFQMDFIEWKCINFY